MRPQKFFMRFRLPAAALTIGMMKRLFVFGLGYSASVIARDLRAAGWTVEGTGGGGLPFADEARVRAGVAAASHVLSSVPPADGLDPVLARYGDALGQAWLGYLSSTGVYGDTGGAWVDETAPTRRGWGWARGCSVCRAYTVPAAARWTGCARARPIA
jgi:hypothetical protein